MTKLWLLYIGGRLAGHIWLTKRDRRNFARGYVRGHLDGWTLGSVDVGR